MARRRSILLAFETDATILQLLVAITGPLGLEVVPVTDARLALAEFEQRRPIAFTIDVAQPAPGGFAFLEDISRHSLHSEVPALVLSTIADPATIRRAYRLGVVDYITRPFDYDVVAPRLRALLRLARDAGELRERRPAGGSEAAPPAPPAPRTSETSTTGRIQLQLGEAVRAARSFAHQIRNPLTAISAAAQLLGRDGIPATMRSNLASTIEAQSQRITDMLSEYIEQRQAAGRRGARIDVAALVHEVLEAGLRGSQTRQRVLFEEAAPLPAVGGDAARLGRMLRALMTHALQATATDSTVMLAMRAESEGVLIDLRYTGREDATGELVQSAAEEAAQAAGGVDSELPIVRQIVEEHGGRLETERTPERGARFTLWLPGMKDGK
ncbi:MAG TPA: ATP-binding protein [Polyangia bacterium]|jgi:signal transduction histidine kinase|nr:ATP-binding protein [Polyangia bacterium]